METSEANAPFGSELHHWYECHIFGLLIRPYKLKHYKSLLKCLSFYEKINGLLGDLNIFKIMKLFTNLHILRFS